MYVDPYYIQILFDMEMSQHYCYIIRRREFTNLQEPIYKIGRTTDQGLKRLLQYDNGMGFEIYAMRKVNNAFKVEIKIKDIFQDKYESMQDLLGSSETFRGNIRDMLDDFHDICDEHICKLTTLEIYDMYDTYGTETLDDILEFTLIKRYLGHESEFTFDETKEILDMLIEGDEIPNPDYGRILGDDSEIEGFTKNHALRAQYYINKL